MQRGRRGGAGRGEKGKKTRKFLARDLGDPRRDYDDDHDDNNKNDDGTSWMCHDTDHVSSIDCHLNVKSY